MCSKMAMNLSNVCILSTTFCFIGKCRSCKKLAYMNQAYVQKSVAGFFELLHYQQQNVCAQSTNHQCSVICVFLFPS